MARGDRCADNIPYQAPKKGILTPDLGERGIRGGFWREGGLEPSSEGGMGFSEEGGEGKAFQAEAAACVKPLVRESRAPRRREPAQSGRDTGAKKPRGRCGVGTPPEA